MRSLNEELSALATARLMPARAAGEWPGLPGLANWRLAEMQRIRISNAMPL
jgi:hypothetical protein